jgi:hypothetical protein
MHIVFAAYTSYIRLHGSCYRIVGGGTRHVLRYQFRRRAFRLGLGSFGVTGLKSKRLWSQQKGHAERIDAFLRAVRGEDVVIPSWEEIRNVTRATILARESIRNGVPFRVE